MIQPQWTEWPGLGIRNLEGLDRMGTILDNKSWAEAKITQKEGAFLTLATKRFAGAHYAAEAERWVEVEMGYKVSYIVAAVSRALAFLNINRPGPAAALLDHYANQTEVKLQMESIGDIPPEWNRQWWDSFNVEYLIDFPARIVLQNGKSSGAGQYLAEIHKTGRRSTKVFFTREDAEKWIEGKYLAQP